MPSYHTYSISNIHRTFWTNTVSAHSYKNKSHILDLIYTKHSNSSYINQRLINMKNKLGHLGTETIKLPLLKSNTNQILVKCPASYLSTAFSENSIAAERMGFTLVTTHSIALNHGCDLVSCGKRLLLGLCISWLQVWRTWADVWQWHS